MPSNKLYLGLILLTLSACSGPWPQLPNNPNYNPDNWRVAEPKPAPQPVVIEPPADPFAPDTQDIGTSADRARLKSDINEGSDR